MQHRRVTRIFIAVYELDAAERSRRLDVLCRKYPELRPEVELLLSFHDRCSGGQGRGGTPDAGLL